MAVGFWFYQTKFVKPIYKAQNQMMHQLVEQQNRLIEQLAKDPKYAIQNDFGKMKPKDGSVITLDLDNKLESTQLVPDTPRDSIKFTEKPKKKSLWKRLFDKN